MYLINSVIVVLLLSPKSRQNIEQIGEDLRIEEFSHLQFMWQVHELVCQRFKLYLILIRTI